MGLEDPLMGGELLTQPWWKVKTAPIVPASHEFVIRGLDPRISDISRRDGRIKSGHDGFCNASFAGLTRESPTTLGEMAGSSSGRTIGRAYKCVISVNPKLSMSLPAKSPHARYVAPTGLVAGVACCKFV